MGRKIAIVGSSGGNLYSQGGNEPRKLLGEIITQAGSAGLEVAFLEFIAAPTSFDNIKDDVIVELYTIDVVGNLTVSQKDTLANVNNVVKKMDAELAELINAGEIDALVAVSADPDSNNLASREAAVKAQIPVAGSGGSAMGVYESSGCKVVSSTGSTGSTNRTRAVAYISSIAKDLGLKYKPVISSSSTNNALDAQSTSVWKRINVRGIMFAAMPAFIAMALMIAIGQSESANNWIVNLTGDKTASFSQIADTLIGLLPVIAASIAAKQVSGFDEVGITAGIIAGSLSVGGGILGGLVTGILAGIIVYYISVLCLKNKVPGTTSNLLAGSAGGLLAGFIGKFLISPAAFWLANGIRQVINMALDYNSTLAGLVAGALIWLAIIFGVYHAAILPIVLVEMEAAGFSFLGAIDLVGLVCVSAGITLANVIVPRDKADRAAALPGFIVNIAFGTFVEAAYPYMFGDKKVFAGAIISAALGGALTGFFDVKSTAYVPVFVAPGLSNGKPWQLVICMLTAFALALVITILANLSARKNGKNKGEGEKETAAIKTQKESDQNA